MHQQRHSVQCKYEDSAELEDSCKTCNQLNGGCSFIIKVQTNFLTLCNVPLGIVFWTYVDKTFDCYVILLLIYKR